MDNSDRFLCLRVDIDDLKRVFIRCAVEKSLSTVHVVIGKVTMTLNNAFMLELMSMGKLSSTSTSIEYLCFSVCIFRLKCWIKTEFCIFNSKSIEPACWFQQFSSAWCCMSWNRLFISEMCASKTMIQICLRSMSLLTLAVFPGDYRIGKLTGQLSRWWDIPLQNVMLGHWFFR